MPKEIKHYTIDAEREESPGNPYLSLSFDVIAEDIEAAFYQAEQVLLSFKTIKFTIHKIAEFIPDEED